MRFGDQTAAGIDISQDQISIVLLKNGKNGPELVRSAVAPMPEGAVKDGNIVDAALLSRAIRELKRRNGMLRTKRAAVSLFAKPVVTQIIDMPKQVPSNIRQFVNNEVKNCVSLPSRDIALDFCTIGSAKRTADKRVLAVAAESARMVELARVCSRAGFSVESIEPSLLAYLRAVYSQKVAGKDGSNVLIAMLRGAVLTLCVLKNGSVDFIRTKEIPGSSTDSVDLNRRLAEELSEVVRFYDIEGPENTGEWEITLFVDSTSSPQVDAAQSSRDIEECLKSKIQTGHLQVRTIEDAYMDTPVAGSKKEQPSPVAVGLAMELLTAQKDDVRINLVPPQIARVREAKRDALIAANAVAVMLLIMVLTIYVFDLMVERIYRNTVAKKQLIEGQDTEVMVEQHQQFDARLKMLSSRLDRLGEIRASHRDVNWADVFEDIRKATPGLVRITGLSCGDGSRVQIEGLAMSNEAVNLFVNLLEKSHNITSVTLLEARKQDGQNGLIVYQLSCKLGIGRGKIHNVG
jgi:Tfp pilus assembly protein PilN